MLQETPGVSWAFLLLICPLALVQVLRAWRSSGWQQKSKSRFLGLKPGRNHKQRVGLKCMGPSRRSGWQQRA